jgi:molybdopterin synthase catalytic subunit
VGGQTPDNTRRKETAISLSRPSLEEWLQEIKGSPEAARIGMYLVHNGVVRGTTRAGAPVSRMDLSYDEGRLAEVVEQVRGRQGVVAVRVWVNQGLLEIGDDIMYALVAGDIRENVFAGLQELVRLIKTEVVKEWEIS